MSETNCSGVRSAASFQTGFPSERAQRSQRALITAARARCATPFSGPSQRSWLSWVRRRQKAPMSFVIDSRVLPTTRGLRARIMATQTSVPRPHVNVRP